MRLFRGLGAVSAAAVALGVVALGSPAQADNILPFTITNVRTGPSPIVAGGGVATEFVITVTNPNNSELFGVIGGIPDSGLTFVSATAAGGKANCEPFPQIAPGAFVCQGTDKAPPTDPQMVMPQIHFDANESVVVTASVVAEAWVPTSTQKFCSVAVPSKGDPSQVCGISVGAPQPIIEVHELSVPSEEGDTDLLSADHTGIPVWAAAEPVGVRGDLFGLAGLVLMPLVGLVVGYRQAKAAREVGLTIRP